MDIIVCLKQVVDPELPVRDFALDPATQRQVREGRPLVISTYDENALEVALQFKDRAGARVTALSVGPASALGDAIRLALAMGADQAVVVDDPASQERSGAEVARMLAAAIRRIGRWDLVLTGCESADWVERVVPPLLAEELGAACVTFATQVETADGTLAVRRLADDGYHLVEARLPAVVSVTSDEGNRPRLPKVKDIVGAKRKPVQTWPAAEMETARVDGVDAGVQVRQVMVPQRTARCEFISGDPAEQASTLVQRLRELKVL